MDGIELNSRDVDDRQKQERRRHARVGVMLMATLRAASGFLDCMVVNLSRGGAKIMLNGPETLERAVSLVLESGSLLRAEVVWQRDQVAGLRFLDGPEAVATAFPFMLPP